MRNWHHGHSIGVGVLGGLLISTHTMLFMVLAFAAGIAWSRTVRAVRGVFQRKARSVIAR